MAQSFVRKSERGLSETRHEKDFHLHWRGYDFLVATREVAPVELPAWPGHLFLEAPHLIQEGYCYAFYIRHVGEVRKPRGTAPSAVKHYRIELLTALQASLAAGHGGAFTRFRADQRSPRHAVLKMSPGALVQL